VMCGGGRIKINMFIKNKIDIQKFTFGNAFLKFGKLH